MRRAKILLLGYLFVIGVLVCLSLVGLALSPPVEREGATYYEAYWNTCQTFDPARAYDTVSGMMVDQCLEGLYEFDGDKWNYDIIPNLAASMPEISEDGRVYTIHLRPNVRYPAAWPDGSFVQPWDGEPRHVRAHDIVFAFKRMADFHNSSPHYAAILQDRVLGANEYFRATEQFEKTSYYYDQPGLELPGVQAIDDLTLRIELINPFPQFIYKLMGSPVSPMPEEYYRHYAVTVPTAKHNDGLSEDEHRVVHERREMKWMMLGTGPYMLDDYERERHVHFVKNPWYRGRPDVDGNPDGLGGVNPSLDPDRVLPYSVEQQEYLFSKADLPRWFNFTLGAYDKIQQIPKDKFGAAMQGGQISPELAAIGMRQAHVPWPSLEFLAFHFDDPILRENRPLRRAMSLAIDRVRLNDMFRNGEEIVPKGLVPPGSFTYDPEYLAPYYRYDPVEAKRLVDEAKRLHRERFGEELPTLTVSYRSTSSTTRQQAEFLRISWEQIGLDVESEFYDFGKWLDNLRSRHYQINSGGWQGDYPDEETFLQLFYSRNYEGGGPSSTKFDDPDFDALYEQAKVMPDSPERRDLYRRMARIIEDEVPVIMLYYRSRREFYFDWLGEISPHVYLRAQPAYYRLDNDLREARLGGEVVGTLEELRRKGAWPPAEREQEGGER